MGYKKVGSRVYRFFALVYFENTIVTFTYTFVKTVDVGWKIQKVTIGDGFDEVEKVVPFIPLGPPRD